MSKPDDYGDSALGAPEWQLSQGPDGLSVSHERDPDAPRFDQVMLWTRHLYPPPEIAWPENWGPDAEGRGVRTDGKPDFPD